MKLILSAALAASIPFVWVSAAHARQDATLANSNFAWRSAPFQFMDIDVSVGFPDGHSDTMDMAIIAVVSYEAELHNSRTLSWLAMDFGQVLGTQRSGDMFHQAFNEWSGEYDSYRLWLTISQYDANGMTVHGGFNMAVHLTGLVDVVTNDGILHDQTYAQRIDIPVEVPRVFAEWDSSRMTRLRNLRPYDVWQVDGARLTDQLAAAGTELILTRDDVRITATAHLQPAEESLFLGALRRRRRVGLGGAAVPEPATTMLLALMCVAGMQRRRR